MVMGILEFFVKVAEEEVRLEAARVMVEMGQVVVM